MYWLNIILVLLAAAIPGIAWLIFFLKEDIHPEPRKIIFYTFSLGVMVSVPIVILQLPIQELFVYANLPAFLMFLVLAFIEEIFKYLAAFWAVAKKKVFDEPIDAMIYMVAAALGLATVENFFTLVNMATSNSFQISEIVDLVIVRFVGATFLHALTSGLVGFYWAKSIILNSRKILFWGLFYATIIHTFFNILIMTFQDFNYLIYPSLFLIFISIIIFKDFDKLRINKK